jgi:hypothetical protein
MKTQFSHSFIYRLLEGNFDEVLIKGTEILILSIVVMDNME